MAASPCKEESFHPGHLHPLMARDLQLIIDLIEVLFEDYSPKNLSLHQLIHLIERETLVRILARFKGDDKAGAEYLGVSPHVLRKRIDEGKIPADRMTKK